MKIAKPDPKRYCAVVFIGGGSSWFWAPTKEAAAVGAAKQAKADWGTMFKFKKKQPFTVTVLDMEKHNGWYATSAGIFSQDTKERLEILCIVEVTA